ncbi:LAFA_0C09230g1_1 [Lachancea sp. 'fantastica']|nr:LAFA_0C09230g1_1 [Lachancea sp. 'fantastica']
MEVSFSSSLSALLPKPKHSQAVSEPSSETQELIAVSSDLKSKNSVDQDPDEFNNKSVNFEAFLPLRQKFPALKVPLPSETQIRETYEHTRAVFDKIVKEKLNPQGTTTRKGVRASGGTKTIEYNGGKDTIGEKGRVLQIVDRQIDPLQPKMFKVKKMVAPPSEDEPFAPILHKSDDKVPQLSKEERAKWAIPSAISNWKNPNGYAIALDKRVAVDGQSNRGLGSDHQISDGFTKLSEALDNAEKDARRDVKLRAEAKRMLLEQDARDKEEKLRLLALKAREERAKVAKSLNSSSENEIGSLRDREAEKKQRRLQLEKDLRQSKMGTADRLRALAAKQNREVSEKVIIGAAKATDTSGVQYDSRFFSKAANANATRSADQVYDNPLFVQAGINTMYRPNFSQLADTQRTEDITHSLGKQVYDTTTVTEKRGREGPVEFTEAQVDQEDSTDLETEPNSSKKHRAI